MPRERMSQRLEMWRSVLCPSKGFAGWEVSSVTSQLPMEEHSTLRDTERLSAFRTSDTLGYA